MGTNTLYEEFLNEIKKKIPQKTQRTSLLVEILSIEKEAVYRRLRGEVAFSFREIVLISQKLSISIDNIIEISSEKSRPSFLKLAEYTNPSEDDYKMFEEYVHVLETGNEKGSLFIEASNVLPLSIIYKFDLLTRFYYFKWNFHYNHSNLLFENFHLPKRLKMLQNRNSLESKKFDSTTFIWDPLIIQYLINDLRFARNMRLINNDEIAAFKHELYNLINYLERIAFTGSYIETNKEVNIFIAIINLDTSYSYLETSKCRLSMVKAFILNVIASFDENTLYKTKVWIQSLIRTSTLISVTSEKQRVSFFENQRALVNQL
ncbi:MAG: hypothetical protein LBV72_18410 [Tannerella sp.]|jgi:hypothetical protein|nr:hypothetical protein [Tannerella sp.]